MKAHPRIVPIVLAAGSSERFGFPEPLAKFRKRAALGIAIENCRRLGWRRNNMGQQSDTGGLHLSL